MNCATKSPVRQQGLVHAVSLQTLDVLDRSSGPDEWVAPWAKACLLVEPSLMTETLPGLLGSRWQANMGRADSYSLYVDEALVFISRERGVWVVEMSFPETGKKPVILGLGCSLVVTPSLVAAAQIAKLCVPAPVAPLQWLPYW